MLEIELELNAEPSVRANSCSRARGTLSLLNECCAAEQMFACRFAMAPFHLVSSIAMCEGLPRRVLAE